MNDVRYLLVVFFVFMLLYLIPLITLAAAMWTSAVSLTTARHAVEVLSDRFFGSFLIPFVTLFSARDRPRRENLSLFLVFAFFVVLSLILTLQVMANQGRIIIETDQSGYEHLLSAVERYMAEMGSYAALIVGIKLTLPTQGGAGGAG